MKKSKIYLLIALLGLVFSACEYDFLAPEKPIDYNDPDAAAISFSGDIVPIFQNKCIGCHKVGGVRPTPDLTADKAYNSIISLDLVGATPEESLIYTKASGNHGGKYSSSEANLVRGWIIQGAEDN